MTRWENPLTGRYYEVRLVQDLWDGWELLRIWGRIGAGHGGQLRQPLPSHAACVQALEKIAMRRRANGYASVGPRP